MRFLKLVRGTRLELAWYNHTPLKRARLPIPPSSLICAAFVPRMIFYHTAAVKVNMVFRFLRTSLTPPGGRNYNRNRTGGKRRVAWVKKEERARMRRLARWLLPPVLLCAGYALWVGLTGRGPACPIHAALGLWCPLCGASRMGLALLRLDLPGALRANAVLLALLLPGTIWGAVHAVRYVRTGDGSVRRWERALLWGAVGVLLAGGVLRNLPAFAFLAPH
jgi:hypothetical protein